MATVQDLSIFRGDDDSWDVTVVDTSNANAPLNLSTSVNNRKFWFTVKQEMTDSDTLIIFQKTLSWSNTGVISSNGISVQNAANGVIRISVVEADTESFAAPMTFRYDLRFKNSDGKVTTLVLGKFQILGNVTRSTA